MLASPAPMSPPAALGRRLGEPSPRRAVLPLGFAGIRSAGKRAEQPVRRDVNGRSALLAGRLSPRASGPILLRPGPILEPARLASATCSMRSSSRGRRGRVGSRFLLRFITYQDGQDVAYGEFLAGRVWQREMRLDLIAVAATVLFLNDITGRCKVRDDPVRPALGDADGICNVPQPRTRILGDQQQDPRMVGQETPTTHRQ
jgi:hypothetical protein